MCWLQRVFYSTFYSLGHFFYSKNVITFQLIFLIGLVTLIIECFHHSNRLGKSGTTCLCSKGPLGSLEPILRTMALKERLMCFLKWPPNYVDLSPITSLNSIKWFNHSFRSMWHDPIPPDIKATPVRLRSALCYNLLHIKSWEGKTAAINECT